MGAAQTNSCSAGVHSKGSTGLRVEILMMCQIEYVNKPNGSQTLSCSGSAAWRNITRRVFSAATSTVQVSKKRAVAPILCAPYPTTDNMPLILIGASTGGVAALGQVLADLHADGPPVLIVQHMPGAFLVSFSRFLNRNLPQDVAIARPDELLSPGQIRLAPSLGKHTEIARLCAGWVCRFVPDENTLLHCPSVDMLFRSAQSFGEDVIGVILTGLGRDGADGLLQLRKTGAQTIGQDAKSSVVYGMPRVAWELGAVEEQLPLNQIGAAVNNAVAAYVNQGARRKSRCQTHLS